VLVAAEGGVGAGSSPSLIRFGTRVAPHRLQLRSAAQADTGILSSTFTARVTRVVLSVHASARVAFASDSWALNLCGVCGLCADIFFPPTGETPLKVILSCKDSCLRCGFSSTGYCDAKDAKLVRQTRSTTSSRPLV
jgi:hypothetical protein